MPDPAKLQRLFEQAIGLPPDERRTFVERETDDPALREEVLELLRHHELAGETLDTPASERFGSLLLPPGDSLGEFTLIRELGRGGMGVVYLARDEELGRLAAVKLLNAAHLGSDLAIGRLRHEAKAVAGLSHPSIVPIYRYGHERDLHFLAMEYVEGRTFEDWLLEATGEGKPPPEGTGESNGADAPHVGGRAVAGLLERTQIRDAISVLVRIGDAIQYAHDKGVIHRDLKPSNILLGEGGLAKVTDFGIALVAAESELTQTVGLIGTPYYMSPEQAGVLAHDLDFRTDIFSLGVGLYRVLTSRLPFTGDSMPKILNSICNDQPRTPKAINPSVDRDLATICMKALEKDPRERYQSVAHFAADLRSWLRGDPILARRPSVYRRLRHFVRRKKALTVGAVAALIIAALAASASIPGRGDRALVSISGAGADGGLVYASLVLDPIGSVWTGTEIGRAPLTTLLEPGVYRFTIVNEYGEFAQTARYLRPSSDYEIDLPVVEPDMDRMVLVPAREIEVGLDGHTGSMGPRRVRVDAFYVDVSEVSNADYKAFLDTTGADEFTPLSWLADGYDDSLADHPVTEIRHAWMQAYAAWAGKRLPTIEEWEAAHIASGIGDPGKRLGLDARGTKADISLDALRLAYKQHTTPVNLQTKTDTGGIGLYHMDGNVREATLTWYERPVTGIVLKGAAYVDDISFVGRDVTATAPPNGAPSPHLGFRCVRSVTINNKEHER